MTMSIIGVDRSPHSLLIGLDAVDVSLARLPEPSGSARLSAGPAAISQRVKRRTLRQN